MPDQNFPSNLLELYQQNTLAGGNPSGQVSPADLTYLQGALLSLQKMFIKHNKTPWAAQLAYVQEAVTPGDVLAIDLNQEAADENGIIIPYVGKYATIKNAGGGSIPIALGLATVTVGVQSYCLYAAQGPIEARFTGLTPGQYTNGTKLSVSLTTNRLQSAAVGDEILAYFCPKGSVLFLGAARAA